MRTPPQPETPRWVAAAIAAVAALFLIGLFSTEMSDPDAWWHLKTGQYIVEQHRLPVPDPFAFTTGASPPGYTGEEVTRRFNLTHEWLAQIMLYGLWAAGGFGAVVFWKALMLSATCGLAGWVAMRRTGNWRWGIAAALAASSIAALFSADRPALVSFLLVAAFIAIFESGRRLWLLPVFALVWANSHGGFFLGWVVCFAYSAEALLRRSDGWRRVLAFSAAAVAAGGLNPNGFRVVQTLLLYRQSFLTSTLVEWRRTYLWGPPYAFDVLLYAAALVLLLSWRRVRIADWILFALFATAALIAFRNMILIAILAPVLIASYFPWKRSLPALSNYMALALLAGALLWGAARGSFFQFRAAEWRYPAGAAQFLAAHHVSVPLFNTYEYGGYLIWRGQRVFIDGRALSESVYQDYRKILGSAPGDPERAGTLARYGIGAIAINAWEYISGVLYPLALTLGNPAQSEWKLVYEDPQSMVFLRDVPPGMPVLPAARVTEHLITECELHVERDPEFSLCARDLGFRFLRAGDRGRARRMLATYVQHPYMDDPEARAAYQQLLLGR